MSHERERGWCVGLSTAARETSQRSPVPIVGMGPNQIPSEAKRTTTCFGFSRPSSNVSLKASTIIRMRGGVSVNLSNACERERKVVVCEIGRSTAHSSQRGGTAFRRTCSRISSDDRPWFCGALASISRYHRLSGNGVNALLGRMGQILLIMGSGVDCESLAAWQHNAAASAS